MTVSPCPAPAPKRANPPFPVASGRDLEPAELTMDEHRCWLFSGPKANYHNDREEARKLGFPNIVVQGMLSTCLVSRVMQQAFGMGWLEGGRMSVKLTSVVWVDERLRCHARVRETVERILADVEARGDAAVRELSERFDGWSPQSFRLSQSRSEERRGGKECRSRWSPDH